MMLKYDLNLDDTIQVGEKTLYRIRALRDFGDVKCNDNGGFVESEANLSQSGNCWVYHNAMVYGKAIIDGNAKIKENASIYGNAKVSDSAIVAGNSSVFQNAFVYDESVIDGLSSVYGNAQVFGKVQIIGQSKVHDDAWVYGDLVISGYANITRKVTLQPIVLTGFTYDVTIMDEHISIDCQTRTFDEWRNVTREEAFAMQGKESLRFFKHIPSTLEFLVSTYRKKKTNV